jgi:hypothetical protein
MRTRSIALVLTLWIAGGASTGFGQPATPSERAKSYTPSLADLMLVAQTRHAKLWYAGNAANWDLANFVIHEIEEGLEDMAKLHPTYKDVPTGKMVEDTIKSPVEEVEKAIKARDRGTFGRAYDKLTAACNACHQAANHAFIVIQRPAASQFPNQSFAPVRQ